MKTKLLLAFALLAGLSASAQKRISIELNYPIPVGKSFIQKNYDGIIDLGFKYRFVNLPVVKIGAGVNTGMLGYIDEGTDSDVAIIDFTLQPKVFAEIKVPGIGLRPYAGIGYSWNFFAGTIDDNNTGDSYDLNETRGGVNFQAGLAFDIIPRLFVTAQYDFTKLSKEDGMPNDSYNNNISLVKVGVGVRL